ncbi:MAG: DUF418 domain-containing protein [Thermoleophilia bacterium]|nr:DUF418 domain-containing protein [Thermoleophilia bacterium]
MAAAPARLAFPDRLRGLALLGIIVVNAPFLAISSSGYTQDSIAAWWDLVAAFLVITLAQGKFYLLFSFLFGYSTLFIVRTSAAADRQRYRRRLVGLAVLGLAHAMLLFIGDILLSYALLGFALMLLLRRPDRAVLRTGSIVFVLSVLWLAVVFALVAATPPEPGTTTAALDNAIARGTFLEAARARLAALPLTLLTLGSLQWGIAFAMFCLGFVAGRRSLLVDLAPSRTLWRRLALFGLLLGLPLQAVAAVLQLRGGVGLSALTAEAAAGLALGFTTAPLLAAGYLGALALVSLRAPHALDAVRDGGRASLTLYLSESIVFCVLFCGWGLGLFGRIGAAGVTLIAIGIYLLLELAIRLWLRRFRQGPFEWLLARWTGPPAELRGVDS